MLILIKAVLPITKFHPLYKWLTMFILLNLWQQADAQFREDFGNTSSGFSNNGIPGWNAVMGDGEGMYTQRIQDGVKSKTKPCPPPDKYVPPIVNYQ